MAVIVPAPTKGGIECLEDLRKQTIPVAAMIFRGPNPSENRNRGILRGDAEFFGFVNAHSKIPSDWAERALLFLDANPSIDGVGGPQETWREAGLWERLSGAALANAFASGSARFRYQPADSDILDADEMVLTSANLVVRRRVVQDVRFDESIYPGEDPKFIQGSREAGFRFGYSPDLIVFNRRRGRLLALVDQLYRYGFSRGKDLGWKKRSDLVFLVPAFFAVYFFGLFPAFLFGVPPAYFSGLFFFFVAGCVFAFFGGSDSLPYPRRLLQVPVFLAIHLSYGIGVIVGYFGRFFQTKCR